MWTTTTPDTDNAATLLPIGQWKTGVTDGRGDVDTFRIDMVGQAAVELRSSGRTDTVGNLKGQFQKTHCHRRRHRRGSQLPHHCRP